MAQLNRNVFVDGNYPIERLAEREDSLGLLGLVNGLAIAVILWSLIGFVVWLILH